MRKYDESKGLTYIQRTCCDLFIVAYSYLELRITPAMQGMVVVSTNRSSPVSLVQNDNHAQQEIVKDDQLQAKQALCMSLYFNVDLTSN